MMMTELTDGVGSVFWVKETKSPSKNVRICKKVILKMCRNI